MNIKEEPIAHSISDIDFSEHIYTINNTGIAYATLVDNEGDKEVKIQKLSNEWGTDNSGKWPHTIRITESTGTKAFVFEKGEKYSISLDIRKVKADKAFNIYLVPIQEKENLSNIIVGKNKKYYFTWINSGAGSQHVTGTLDLTNLKTDRNK